MSDRSDKIEEIAPQIFDFDVELSLTGDTGSSFRTQNDPASPYQRDNYIERKGVVDVRCSSLDVIHGTFSTTDDTCATLIVLEFRFGIRKQARRFKSVNIKLEYEAMSQDGVGPEVYAIAPFGTQALMPTTQREETQRNLGLQVGGSAPVAGATVMATGGWTKTVSRNTSDATAITGSIDLVGRNWGKPNCASWNLLENASTKTGVPAYLRTGVLLRRADEEQFKCIVKIDATVDLKSSMSRVFGGKGRYPRDDPVLFDPEARPTNKLQNYDDENLGAFDLESLYEVTFAAGFSGETHEKTR